MFNLNREHSSSESHHCESQQRGDWIIFRCVQCDYIRKINYKTKKMKSVGGDPSVIHHGASNAKGWARTQWN